jgi:hypothetical protein
MTALDERMKSGQKWALVALVVAVAAARVVGDGLSAPFADQIQMAKAQINNCQQTLASWWSNEASQAPEYQKLDYALIQGDMQSQIDAWQSAVTAWQKGDAAAGQAALVRAQALGGHQAAWAQRLDWRIRQHLAAPTEDSFELAAASRPRHGVALMIEAQKKVSQACARVAYAYVPGFDASTMDKLKDAVFEAQLNLEIADMKATWEGEDHSYALRDAVSSPGLTAAQRDLDAHRAAREKMYRDMRTAQHAIEQFDRLNGPLLAKRDRAAEQARDRREMR